MIYRLIKNLDDEDIPIILSAYKKPSISQFISIDKENYWKYIDGSCNACTCSLQAFRGSTGFNFNSRTFAMPDLSCDFDTYSLSDNAINLEKFIRGKILLNISKLRFFRYSDRYGTLSRQS